jgi:cell division protein FtsA
VGVVDFGSRSLRVLIARKEADGAVYITGHGVAPAQGCVCQGVIQDLQAAQRALRNALSQAEKEARTGVSSLFCGIQGRNVETFIREGNVEIARGAVEPAELAEAKDIAARDILAPGKKVTSSISAQEWYVDGLRVADPVGIHGQVLKVRVHFARIPAVILDNVAGCIESLGRELEDMIFLPLAASIGCLTPEDMELGVALIDIGHRNIGVSVYRDYRNLNTHCFERGGYHITRDVAAGLQISFEEANELILEYGVAESLIRREVEGGRAGDTPKRHGDEQNMRIKLKTAVPGAPPAVDRNTLEEIIFERAKELMTLVRQYLQARDLTKNLVRGVVLTGGASQIRNHVALAEAVFQTPCRVGLPNNVEILPHEVKSPEFSAAVGIVRHAFEYRAAARNGRVNGASSTLPWHQRMARLVRKYFL